MRDQGMGSIDQRPNGTWRGRIQYINPVTSRTERSTVSGKTKSEVQDKLRKLQNRIAEGLPVQDSDNLLAPFLEEHFKLLEGERKASTVRGYRDIASSTIIPLVGNVRLRDLTTALIEKTLGGAGEKARSRALAINILSGAMERAVSWKLIAANPCRGVARPRVDQRVEEIHYWSADQVRRFLDFVRDDLDYAIFHLAISTGARKGELLALEWRDFNPQTGLLRIERSMDFKTGKLDTTKAGRGRAVQLSAPDVALLERLAEHSQARYMLANPMTGKPQRHIAQRFRRLIAAYNAANPQTPLPEIRFHDLRHTCATLLLAAGVPVKVVSERLGHAHISITLSIYSHVIPAMQEQAAQAMAGVFAGV